MDSLVLSVTFGCDNSALFLCHTCQRIVELNEKQVTPGVARFYGCKECHVGYEITPPTSFGIYVFKEIRIARNSMESLYVNAQVSWADEEAYIGFLCDSYLSYTDGTEYIDICFSDDDTSDVMELFEFLALDEALLKIYDEYVVTAFNPHDYEMYEMYETYEDLYSSYDDEFIVYLDPSIA